MKDFIIKILQPADVSQARELIKVWQEDGFAAKATIPGNDYLHDLMAGGSFHVIVAIINGRVVGGVTAYELTMFDKQEKEMFLYDIAVSREHRNKNIAKELIAELKKICADQGIRIMFVGTTPDNDIARQLYQATGAEQEIVSWYTYNIEQE